VIVTHFRTIFWDEGGTRWWTFYFKNGFQTMIDSGLSKKTSRQRPYWRNFGKP
jgi:hypothetical protein